MSRQAQPSTPAFYAWQRDRLGDWWTLLHPPYTLWHLSYVAIGAALAPSLSWTNLVATLLAFLLAVGIAAHALDELHGRPLRTRIGARTLVIVTALALGGAVVLGVIGTMRLGSPVLSALIAVGVLLVLGYNLEWFAGRLHTDHGFALSWGSFPVLVGLVGQAPPLDIGLVVTTAAAMTAAAALSYAQRRLSNPARTLRRKVSELDGQIVFRDGNTQRLDRHTVLRPLEAALGALCIALPSLAIAMLALRIMD